MARLRDDQSRPPDIAKTVAILGGCAAIGQKIANLLDVHRVIERGFPKLVLRTLVENVPLLQNWNSLHKATGISMRTYFRKTGPTAASPLLTSEQSGRTWRLAQVLVKATHVFGTQARAEQWMEEPAYGLDLQRPIDLLTTPAGIEMVETYLDQIEYGVFV